MRGVSSQRIPRGGARALRGPRANLLNACRMRSADPDVARTAISSSGGGQAVAGNRGAGFMGASGLGTDARDRAGTGARGAVGVKILLVHPGASWSCLLYTSD